MHETTFIELQVTTFDGKTHKVSAHKKGKTWRASAYVDKNHVEGQGAPDYRRAFKNWQSAYKYRFES
jgi:hypothetical protein